MPQAEWTEIGIPKRIAEALDCCMMDPKVLELNTGKKSTADSRWSLGYNNNSQHFFCFCNTFLSLCIQYNFLSLWQYNSLPLSRSFFLVMLSPLFGV